MAARMDVVSIQNYKDRDGNEKSRFTNIGVAWETKNGWAITFTALPLPQMTERGLETRVLLMPPKDQAQQPSRSSGGGRGGYDEDSIPFGPEWR